MVRGLWLGANALGRVQARDLRATEPLGERAAGAPRRVDGDPRRRVAREQACRMIGHKLEKPIQPVTPRDPVAASPVAAPLVSVVTEVTIEAAPEPAAARKEDPEEKDLEKTGESLRRKAMPIAGAAS